MSAAAATQLIRFLGDFRSQPRHPFEAPFESPNWRFEAERGRGGRGSLGARRIAETRALWIGDKARDIYPGFSFVFLRVRRVAINASRGKWSTASRYRRIKQLHAHRESGLFIDRYSRLGERLPIAGPDKIQVSFGSGARGTPRPRLSLGWLQRCPCAAYEGYLRGPWPTPRRRRARLWCTLSNPARILADHPSTLLSTRAARERQREFRLAVSRGSSRETWALWNIYMVAHITLYSSIS